MIKYKNVIFVFKSHSKKKNIVKYCTLSYNILKFCTIILDYNVFMQY